MKQNLTLIGALLLVPSLCSAGTLTSMKKDEITNAFTDKTITTIPAATLNGNLIKNTFTGYFSKDGKANGSFHIKPDNEPQNDTGTWKVDSDNKLCFKWDHWDNGNEKCVSVYKLSNGFLIINNQNAFESIVLSKQIQSGNQMGTPAQ